MTSITARSRTTRKLWLLACALVLVGTNARAQSGAGGFTVTEEEPAEESEQAPIEDIVELSLEDLLNIESNVSSRSKSFSLREAPAIMTIVDREEIQRSGAKDLIDVLKLVAGFQFGIDAYGATYMGVRGLWAAEGKVLVLLDGHEMQELLYSGTMLGNRIPVDWIKRIEIIRGPGSVMYGGTAALAVVNIVTREPGDLEGLSFTGSYGQMLDGVVNHRRASTDDSGATLPSQPTPARGRRLTVGETFSQRYLSLSYGQTFSQADDLGLGINLFAGQGNLSDQPYTDIYGSTYNVAGNADRDPLMANLKLTYQGLTLRYLFERYSMSMRDGWGENLDATLPLDHTSSSTELSYEWRPIDELTITPRVRHTFQKPWQTDSAAARDYDQTYWDPTVQRVLVGLVAAWDTTDWLNLMLGADYNYDRAEDEIYGFAPDTCDQEGGRNIDPDGCKTLAEYHNVAVYGQGLVETPVANISAGARFEHHSQFGSSFVPRGAVTKAFGPFNYKLLVSQSFRAPSIMNMAASLDVKPEKTTVFEGELGYKLTDELFLVGNAFFIMVDDPLIYYYDEETYVEGYMNYKQTGTAGTEIELRLKVDRNYANLGYSFYHPAGQNEIETFTVPGHDNVLLGFAQHKLTLNGGIEVIRDVSFNLSGTVLFGDRYGYDVLGADEWPTLRKFDPEVVLNANVMYRNLIVDGLYAMVGLRNFLNDEIYYIQPYDNWHTAMPGPSIEVFVKLGYDLSFD